MLADIELEKLMAELSIPDEGRKLIRHARKHSPVRAANSYLGNCIVWHYSRKMGNKHLELESRTVEAPSATLYEDDNTCLEFWPQPFKVDLSIKDDNGRVTTRKQHTPDFLIIKGDGIYVHEWREEARLIRLTTESSIFYKDSDHRWHNRAAEDYFEKLGIRYELHSALEHPRTFVMNVDFLKDYNAPTCPTLHPDVQTRIVDLLAEEGSIPHLELLQKHGFTSDHIFTALINKSAYVDLHTDLLSESADLMIHRDISVAKAYHLLKQDHHETLPIPGLGRIRAGSRIEFDGKIFEVVLVGGGNVLLKDNKNQQLTLPIDQVETLFANSALEIQNFTEQQGTSTRSIAELSQDQIDQALKRLDAINSPNSGIASQRSICRWKEKIKGALSTLDQLLALANRDQDKGNRLNRLPEEVEFLAEEAIRRFYNTPEGRTSLAIFQKYQILCEEHGIKPMSYPTFTKRVKKGTSKRLREGKRKAYQDDYIPLYLDYRYPVHGVRPHEVCYIDHTIMNVATVGPSGTDLGKPTYTLATDGNTTQARAFYVSYDPPSAVVVLMVLRDYVRRNHKLPAILVVDGGKEFRSKRLKLFCRLYGIKVRHRPAGRPRGGSPVERAMGAAETEVLAKLEGNTRIMKNARMVTKSVNPFPNATWTLTALHGALEEYLFDIRNNRIHPSLGLTPIDFEKMRIAETGVREHVFVRFDENLMLMTSPHTKHMLHKIDNQRGVWSDNMHYWNDEFRTAKAGTKVEVRIEPWNANVVYVHYRNKWIAAIARDLKALGGRTRREVEVAVREERRRAKTNSNKDRLSKVSAKKMAKLWSPEKFDERLGKQQREMEYLYSKLEMTVAMKAEVADQLRIHDQSSKIFISSNETDISIITTQQLQADQYSEELEDEDNEFWGESSDFI